MLRERRKKLLWDEVQLRRHFLIVGLLNGEQIAREVIDAGCLLGQPWGIGLKWLD